MVPSSTNTASLTPSVYFTGVSLNPGSDTANNFTSPAVYTVTGKRGQTKSYTVMVHSTPSHTKDITGFKFFGVANAETVIGAAPDGDGTYSISVHVPQGTPLESLVPEITHTGVSVSPGGGTARNFSGPQTYTVTAEDGTTKTYTVKVTVTSGGTNLITSLIFEEVPLNSSAVPPPPPVRVVASIDQDNRIITAMVPFAANIDSLSPVITYIGKSIAPPGLGEKTENPFTDTGRNFSSPQTYTVTAQDGSTRGYTVTVNKQSAVTISFQGDTEQDVINDSQTSFNQSTGIISVTVNNGFDSVGWYVNGVKQGGSGNSFSLNVGNGSFISGRHQIMAVGKKNGQQYSDHVYFTVSGGVQ
jgi:hypothetical protein